MDKNNELVTYIIINKNLEMSPGKAAVQAARANIVLFQNEYNLNTSYMKQSFNELFSKKEEGINMFGNKTVILKASQKDLKSFLNEDGKYNKKMKIFNEEILNNSDKKVNYFPVYDMGRNEVETNSLTAIILSPFYEKELKENITKRFQVY